jgi:hypothetical protein
VYDRRCVTARCLGVTLWRWCIGADDEVDEDGLSLTDLLARASDSRRHILVLGAGFVSGPLIGEWWATRWVQVHWSFLRCTFEFLLFMLRCTEYLLRRPENHLTVASVILSEAAAFAKRFARVTPICLDVTKVGRYLACAMSSASA